MASRDPTLFKVGKERGFIDEEAPAVPSPDKEPTMAEIADVIRAAAEYLCALLDREKMRGH